jgi:nuclear pore complex protein Nup98-Nup96
MRCEDRASQIMGSQGREIFVPRPPSQSLGSQIPRGTYRAAAALNDLKDQTSQSRKLTHSLTGGFGSTNNNNTTTTSLFGQNKPAFGSANTSSAPSLFGNNTTSTGFGASSGGFGSNASTGFGAANNNTGSTFSFGSQTNKPAFGSNTGSTLFGQGGSGTTGGFGSSNNAFGSASGTALNQAVPPSEGTGVTPFQPTNETETNGGKISYQSISFQQPYQKYSFEVCNLHNLLTIEFTNS